MFLTLLRMRELLPPHACAAGGQVIVFDVSIYIYIYV